MSNPAGRYMDIYEWREECNLARQEVEHLREKVAELAKERDEWKMAAMDFSNVIKQMALDHQKTS